MKKTILGFVLLTLLFAITSCDKDGCFDDSDLVCEIQNASKTAISPNQLPTAVTNFLSKDYTNYFVSYAAKAAKGYEVVIRPTNLNMMDEQWVLYFDNKGQQLDRESMYMTCVVPMYRCFEFVTQTTTAATANTRQGGMDGTGIMIDTRPDEIVFPLTIQFDNSVVTIANVEELKAAYSRCDGEQSRPCYDYEGGYEHCLGDYDDDED